MALILLSAQQTFTDFGLVVNTKKTEGPAQQLSFLGIQLDSVKQTLSCTPARLTELRALLSQALAGPQIRLSFLASLIGKLQFAATVLPGARPFVRRMLDLQQVFARRIRARHSQRPGSTPRSITTPSDPPAVDPFDRRLHFSLQRCSVYTDRGFRADARFWLTHLHQWNGTARWRSAQATPFRIATDASLDGFGFYLESTPPHVNTSQWPQGLRVGSGFSGVYSPAHQHLHTASSQMTWCEMFAVYAALLTYRTVLRHSCVLFLVDNETRCPHTQQAGYAECTPSRPPAWDLFDMSPRQYQHTRPTPKRCDQYSGRLPVAPIVPSAHRHRVALATHPP